MSNVETNKFMIHIWSRAAGGFLAIHSLPSNRTRFYDLFVKGELEKSVKEISSSNGQQNIYHTMGLLKIPPVKGRGEQANVIAIPGLWMDFDVKGGNHKNQNLPGSIDECREFIKTLEHQPSIIVASGGGLHGYWLFDKILYFNNDEERNKVRKLSKIFQQSVNLKAAANGWEFDDTSDLIRLLRIPGTLNYKDRKKPKNVKILNINDRKYSIDQFENLDKGNCPNSNNFDTSLILQGVPKGKRNESIFRYARSLFAKGLTKKDAWLLVKNAACACDPPLSEKEAQNCFQSASRYHSRDRFSEKTKFIPTQLTNYIREIHDLFYDGADYFRYTKKGFWEKIHELEIKKDMIAALGKKATNAKINNAMG
ncbi:MAG: primase alpha helix C-terminal domain-containing protein, partial [Desulfobacterales bacterium]